MSELKLGHLFVYPVTNRAIRNSKFHLQIFLDESIGYFRGWK